MNIWEKTFRDKEWGKYPPEELIRAVCEYTKDDKTKSVLEMGCGPGANSLFLNEHFQSYSAIDFSKTAIEKLKSRLSLNQYYKTDEFKVACFSSLPWGDKSFDFICDNLAITHNDLNIIKKTLKEVRRVLKEGGLFYSKVWGSSSYGLNTGELIEEGTFTKLKDGPCKNYGVSHFFTYKEIKELYGGIFKKISVEKIQRTKLSQNENIIEEFIILARKI